MTIIDLQRLVWDIVHRYVAKPAELRVSVVPRDYSIDVTLLPHADDTGRVIGPRGARWKALRNYLSLISIGGLSVFLMRVPEPKEQKADIFPSFNPQDGWPQDELANLAHHMSAAVFYDQSLISVDVKDGEGYAVLEIHVGAGEKLTKLREVSQSYTILFEAMGLMVGKPLRTVICPDQVPQPRTADGRNSPETPR